MKDLNIILASSSPRRIEMLESYGITPIIMPPCIDETIPPTLSVAQAVMYIALKKALQVEKDWVAFLQREERLQAKRDLSDLEKQEPKETAPPYIIAADTVVYKDRIIGKPVDVEDATNILLSLKNTSNFVLTGVAIVQAQTNVRKVFYEMTEVFFKDYSEADIAAYLNTPEPWDKAGAYAIQGAWAKHISHIQGDLNNVIGFPWDRIRKELNKM